MYHKTIGDKNPAGLQKVFIAMDDSTEAKEFLTKLEKIIFANFNCAIYFDPTVNIEELNESISMMDVVVYILTSDMLHMGNRYFDELLTMCGKLNIPIVPLLMKIEMEEQYSRIFHEKQYLCPNDHDDTKISFERKLIDRLSSILLCDELVERVCKVFRKSLFLSYRKKSRIVANEFMRTIHCNRAFTNIAVWYDERITTGESFSYEIEKAMCRADGFVLLATDAILERPNYVHDVEYKKALEMDNLREKIIAVRLDKEPISDYFYELYESIPIVYSGINQDFYEHLLEITGLNVVYDADSLYLMGLAYQNGICVEINPNLAIELLLESAEKANKSAIMRLVDTFVEGIGVEKNYDTAILWQKKLIESVSGNPCTKEYQKLADIYEKKHDWNTAIDYYRKALENLSDNYECEDEIVTSIVRIAMKKNNDDGFEIALDTCLECLYSLADRIKVVNDNIIGKLSMVLFETISILFELNDSKRFNKKIETIADIMYDICSKLSSVYPDLKISEYLHDSVFHDVCLQQSIHFFKESGIISENSSISSDNVSFRYNDNAMFAEELSYINLALEMVHMRDDFPSCYKRVIKILTKTINFYMERGLFDFAYRNAKLVERVLSEAEHKWYLNIQHDVLEWMLLKTELYFRKRDERAVDEMERLFTMLEENLLPSEYLVIVEVIDKFINLVPTDSLAEKLLIRQEKILERIPKGIYDDVAVWKLYVSVNRYQSLLMNGDKNAIHYYDQAMQICNKLQDQEESLVFRAIQRLYLIYLHYATPESPEGLSAVDTVIDALFNNTSVFLNQKGEIDNMMKGVLVEVDQYLNWLRSYHPEHFQKSKSIIFTHLKEIFIPYVNSIMITEPSIFLPPMIRYEFTDFALITGIDLNFLKTFRSLFFIVHSFIVSNADDKNEKIKSLDKLIAMYDMSISKTNQGYLFQMLHNEKNILVEYRKKLI